MQHGNAYVALAAESGLGHVAANVGVLVAAVVAVAAVASSVVVPVQPVAEAHDWRSSQPTWSSSWLHPSHGQCSPCSIEIANGDARVAVFVAGLADADADAAADSECWPYCASLPFPHLRHPYRRVTKEIVQRGDEYSIQDWCTSHQHPLLVANLAVDACVQVNAYCH